MFLSYLLSGRFGPEQLRQQICRYVHEHLTEAVRGRTIAQWIELTMGFESHLYPHCSVQPRAGGGVEIWGFANFSLDALSFADAPPPPWGSNFYTMVAMGSAARRDYVLYDSPRLVVINYRMPLIVKFT